MSGVLRTTVSLDRTTRDAVASGVLNAVAALEEKAHASNERVIWDSISFNSETDYDDESTFSSTAVRRHKFRTLTVAVRTIQPGVDL